MFRTWNVRQYGRWRGDSGEQFDVATFASAPTRLRARVAALRLGFFPRMASLVVVPIILTALVGDLLLRLRDAFSSKVETVRVRLIRISIPVLLLCGSLYWLSQGRSAA